MPSARVLLVEDEPGLQLTLSDRLAAEGYSVETAGDGDTAIKRGGGEPFDLIVLDVMLPGRDGFEVARTLRQQGVMTPILMLTARTQVVDRVVGLKLGADDYLTKPFSPRELIARVAAIMRRIRPALAGETIAVGDLSLDATAHRVTRRGQPLALGPTEFRLLRFFMEHPGRVFSRGQLLDAVWGTGSDIELRTVDVHIRRLRKGIEVPNAPDPVRTVRSAGYALEAV